MRPRAQRDVQARVLELLAHEMRAPLCTILGLVDLLEETPGIDAERRDMLRDIARAGERLNRLLEDGLAAAGDAGEAWSLDLAPVDLEAALRRAVRESGGDARLRLELPAGLPYVRADADRVVQIAVNLLANALRYAPPGSCVRLAAEAQAGCVRIRVRDEGPGLPDAERCFEAFERGDDDIARRHAGRGLGLFVAKSLVEAHGGTIAAEAGPGCTIAWTLPLWHGDRGAASA